MSLQRLKIKWKVPHKHGSPWGYKPKEQMCVINGVTEACERKTANVFNIIKRRWAYFTRIHRQQHTHTLMLTRSYCRCLHANTHAVYSNAIIPTLSFSTWIWNNIQYLLMLVDRVYTCKFVRGGKGDTAEVGVILNTTLYTFEHIYEAFSKKLDKNEGSFFISLCLAPYNPIWIFTLH